jgi:hypothetical protein
VRRLLSALASVLLLTACSGAAPFGAPCGGAQFAEGRAFLPDTGINSGDTLLVVFIQHDGQELSEFVIWHLWPFASGAIDPEPDPRVRVITDDGRVLLDSIGSRFNQPENTNNRPTWYSFTWIREAGLRNDLYEGLRDETLSIELTRPTGTAPGTRVRIRTDRAGISPVMTCL